ncbi:alpha/beta hydrolase [soil metagenome]
MTVDRRSLLGSGLILSAGLTSAAAAKDAPDPADVIELWPAGAPGGERVTVKEAVTERRAKPTDLQDRAATGVRRPILTVFRPRRPNGAAVIITPGGSYLRVVVDKEGYETARWLASRGYTCFVLRYRLPGDGWAAGPDTPLQDAQRAIRLVRGRAAAMGFDAARVAVMGFSSGGHVAGSLITRHAAQVYAPIDAADQRSARPDLGCLVYPVLTLTEPSLHAGSRKELLGDTPTRAQIVKYSVEQTVDAQTPPTILFHAADDATVPVENSVLMFRALTAAKIKAELHIFDEGAHGFGLRFTEGKPVAAWPELFATWAKQRGL